MEPIVLQMVPHERYSKKCYLCEEAGKESKVSVALFVMARYEGDGCWCAV